MITFHEIYERHAQDVYRYACWLSGNADNADDITSGTFARAWAGRDEIRTETVKAYLFAIARNLYLQENRKAKHMTGLNPLHADPQPGPDQVTESRLELIRAMAAVQSLPEVDRAAFYCEFNINCPMKKSPAFCNFL